MSESDDHFEKLARMAFGHAFQPQILRVSDETIEDLIAAFEDAAQTDDEGNQFWFARDLQKLLGYSKWDNFLTVVQRARDSCTASGHSVADHFAGVGKMISLGKGAEREIEDIVLSRYASYRIAQNGDARKREIAFAQTYFAIQARRQEIADEKEASYSPLTEDERRCLLRDEIKEHNKNLASATGWSSLFPDTRLQGAIWRIGCTRHSPSQRLESRPAHSRSHAQHGVGGKSVSCNTDGRKAAARHNP
jgi:DNA-damage-inducible protein D